MEPTQNKTNGALIGSIIIITILIIGGIYLLKTKALEREENTNVFESSTSIENTTTSDSIEDIEADLNLNADMDSLDAGLE
jgi:Ca2+/Na+ antiporter